MDWNLLDWQTIVSLAIVFGAIGILCRKTWRSLSGGSISGCGTSCSGCPAGSDSRSETDGEVGIESAAPKVIELIQLGAQNE